MSRGLAEKDTLPGRLLRNNFLVAGRIASGAVCDVYLARQKSVGGRTVAVKVLKRIICADEAADANLHRQRFRFEVELLNLLKAAAFARIIDAGILDDEGISRPFMIMEHLPGQTLAERLRSGPLPLALSARLTLEVGEALQELHRLAAVYRDLSPGNVILEEAGPLGLMPRLFDFSHAIIPGVEAMAAGQEQLLIGTPAFSAPELGHGRGDLRSDVFSLGALFFAMVSAAPPVRLRNATWEDYLQATSRIGVLPESELRQFLPQVPKGLDALLRRAMAVNPDDRYESLDRFLIDFAGVLLDSTVGRQQGRQDGSLLSLLARTLLGK